MPKEGERCRKAANIFHISFFTTINFLTCCHRVKISFLSHKNNSCFYHTVAVALMDVAEKISNVFGEFEWGYEESYYKVSILNNNKEIKYLK